MLQSKEFFKCCWKNTAIGVLSVVLLIIGLSLELINYHHNLVILLLWYTILQEMSKSIIQMLVGDDAPIMLRYTMAGMAVASTKEFYIQMLEKDALWMLIYAVAGVFFMGMRWWALKMTENGR